MATQAQTKTDDLIENLLDHLGYSICIWKDKKEAVKYYLDSDFQLHIDFTRNPVGSVITKHFHYYNNWDEINLLKDAYKNVQADVNLLYELLNGNTTSNTNT